MADTQLYSLDIASQIHPYKVNFEGLNDSLYKNLVEGDVLIIDSNVYNLHKKFFKKLNLNFFLIKIKSTEKNKSYKFIENVIFKIINYGFKKNNKIIAIGGGVIQDISGFISSILFRGSKWIFYPTTLLAQGDSCIGGKSSINLKNYKNQLGGFYPPYEIYIDITMLKTLPHIEILSGLGEICHYFLIKGGTNFEFFKKNWNDANKLEEIIYSSLLIKKDIIERDEFDKNERQILNYGHSFGHAIESISDYKIPHGIAVSLGMDIANFISYKLGYISFEFFSETSSFLENFWMNNEISKEIFCIFNKKDYILPEFILALKKDKKNVKDKFVFILSKGTGNMFKDEISSKDFVYNCLNEFLNLKLCLKTPGTHHHPDQLIN